MEEIKGSEKIAMRLGFDFYGSSNIGEDLMLSGFLHALVELGVFDRTIIYAACRFRLESQRKRFPAIRWLQNEDIEKVNKYKPDYMQYWVGLGDTPFQLTSGDWLLKYLQKQIGVIHNFRSKCLINVGAESEIIKERDEFSKIANAFDRISTRDTHTSNILTTMLGVSPSKVFTAADLANISLSKLTSKRNFSRKKFRLGLIIAGDTLDVADIAKIKMFIASRPRKTAFLVNDLRRGYKYERDMYAAMAKGILSRITMKLKSQVILANYDKGSLYDLIKPIGDCNVIISSRYHGVLIAAWLGCKVAGIGRSSKVIALAKELGIPCCDIPLREGALEYLEQNAVQVSEKILKDKASKAIKGVGFAINID